MTASAAAAWIGVDWGTSRCRAFAFDAADQVIDHAEGGPGMKALDADGYEAALLDLAGGWLDGRTPVLICGMAGARQGWCEAPYRTAPCSVTAESDEAVAVATHDPRLRVKILPGLCQTDRSAPDVMRGEETQLLGFAARNPEFEGLVCLPGTHAKWVRLAGGEIMKFQTFMTGELFDLLTAQSILRFSTEDSRSNTAAFKAAVIEAAQPDAPMSAQLFRIRAGDLLFDAGPGFARSRLSGLLIGDEIRNALKAQDTTGPVGLVGDDRLCDLYESALATLTYRPLRISGQEAAIEGLRHAYRALSPRAWSAHIETI